ncbi:MAG: hypothetical protein CVU46_14055 [Chloroflexi bacterium HGW-Chloroflexi-8]|nr:MAG: hypothetical protein CVU46_14055 [Chloroflexi bacterium HGW-Chloroflexi-8]
MKIRLLGTPKLFWDDKPITLHRKMARFLIYYLSIHNVMLGRSEIALDFWPDQPNSRQMLRDLLSKAKQELPDPDIILTDRDWVGLNHDLVEVDVIEFEELYQQLTLPFLSVENRPLPEAVFQKAIVAVNMWETPNIFSGISAFKNEGLEDWVYRNNKRLQAKRLDLMSRISQHLIATGDLEEALTWLTRANELDFDYDYPNVVFLKILVLFRLQKLTQAFVYGQSMIEEMGYDWFGGHETSLKALMAQIDDLRFRKPEITSVSRVAQPTNQMPITGRETLLRNLQRASQRNGVVLLQGESGSGKTRILQEFRSQYNLPDMILHMHANYFQSTLSFHPVLDALRENLKESDWLNLDSFWGILLIPFFPELQRYWSGSLSNETFVENRSINSMEAFNQLFRKLASNGKLIIILDDAQWADPDTMNLMIYLAQRHFFLDKGFLIIAYRPETDNPLLTEILTQKHRLEVLTTMEIEPLGISDILQIGFSVFRKPISEELAKRIQGAGGGNALFIIETMQAMAELHGLTEETRVPKLPLPGIVHAILRNRILNLSETSRQIIECAAIVGDPFTFSRMIKMVDINENDLIHGIDELIKAGLVEVEVLPFMKNQYHFKFEFLREVATLETSSVRKENLHFRMAKILEQELEQTQNSHLLSEIASHYSEGGEPVTAFNYLIQYAQSSQTSFYERSALDAFQNAQYIANSLTSELSSEQLYDLYIGWGDLALYRYELDIADGCFKNATIEGQKRYDPFLMGAGYSGLGELFGLRGIFLQANQYLDYAANFLDETHFGEFIRLKVRKANLLLMQSMPIQAITILKGLAIYFQNAKSKFDYLIIAEAYYYLAYAYLSAGEFRFSLEACSETAKILKTHRLPPLQSRLEMLLGSIAYSTGNFQKAHEHYGASLQISEFYSAWYMALQAAIFSSYTFLKQGKIFQSWEQIKNGLHLAEVYNFSGNHGLLLNAQARIFLYLGKLDLAKEYFEKALTFSLTSYHVVFNQKDLGFAQFLIGDEETGLKNMEEAIHLSQIHGFRSIEVIAKSEMLLLKYHKNRDPELLDEMQALTQITQSIELAGAGSSYAYIGTLESIRNKQFEQAEKFISILEEIGKKEGSLWFQWHVIELTIQLHQAQGTEIKEDQIKRVECIRNIKQLIPKEIKKTIDLKTPPLAGLV